MGRLSFLPSRLLMLWSFMCFWWFLCLWLDFLSLLSLLELQAYSLQLWKRKYDYTMAKWMSGRSFWYNVDFLLQCGSGRSVAPIKAGFVARVGRRKAGTWWGYLLFIARSYLPFWTLSVWCWAAFLCLSIYSLVSLALLLQIQNVERPYICDSYVTIVSSCSTIPLDYPVDLLKIWWNVWIQYWI